MNLIFRLEKPDDYRAVEEMTREAFWGYMEPTCDEHYLVHQLRGVSAFVPELDYVAEADGKIVGNIVYSKAKVVGSKGEYEVLTFGPLSVLPQYWNRGVGAALVRYTAEKAKGLGCRAIIIYGHPDYYPRLGFRRAKDFGITAPSGKSYDALMALPLYEGALDGVSGGFHLDQVYDINAEKAKAFNRQFSHIEPAYMPPIELLLDKLEPSAQKAFNERDIKTLAWLVRFSGREMLGWEGVDESVLDIVNQTLRENGYPQKLPPSSDIFK